MTHLGIEGIVDAVPSTAGGSSVIYEARQADFDRRVAVKILRGPANTELQRRFDRERRAVGRLSGHPGIVDIYEGGVTDTGELYLVMPFIEGGSLQTELDRKGAFRLEQAIRDVMTAAEAVDFAHRHGVIHRDIKPGNLLRGATGLPVVTDFGIARIRDSGVATSTVMAATPLYAAPEVLADDEASEASDVYSLAALLYALLSGRPPFSDKPASNIWTLIERIRTEPAPAIQGVPVRVMEVIEQAMAKDPADRPTSAGLFAQYLRFALEDSSRRPDNFITDVPSRPTVTPIKLGSAAFPATPARGIPKIAASQKVKTARSGSSGSDIGAAAAASSIDDSDLEPTVASDAIPTGATAVAAGATAVADSTSPDVKINGTTPAVTNRNSDAPSRLGPVSPPGAPPIRNGSAPSYQSNGRNGDAAPPASPHSAQPPSTPAEVYQAPASSDSRLALAGVAIGCLVLVVAAVGLFRLVTNNSTSVASDEVSDPVESAVGFPTPIVIPVTPKAEEAAPPPESTVMPTPMPTPTPEQNYENPRFASALPEGWIPLTENVDVGYGYRTRFQGPASDFMFIDTTPADRARAGVTIEESAHQVAATISSSSPVRGEMIGDKQTWSFTYTGNDGTPRIDIFFTVNGDGYAVVAGSGNDPANAFDVARDFIASLESTTT